MSMSRSHARVIHVVILVVFSAGAAPRTAAAPSDRARDGADQSTSSRLVTGAGVHLQHVVDLTTAGSVSFYQLMPVPAQGDVTYGCAVASQGLTFTVSAGSSERLFFELRMGGWGGAMDVWQATIDFAPGYTSGSGAALTRPSVACAAQSDCIAAFGAGSLCGMGHCTDAFQDISNPDLVSPGITVVNTPTMTYGSTVLASPPTPDVGQLGYGGTLVLDVPADAQGTYTIGFAVGPDTFMGVDGSLIAVAEFRPSVINVVANPDCNANGTPDSCDIADGTSIDCNGNGIPDECDIAAGASLDVVGAGGLPDGIPDECQTDCNNNLIPDDQDVASGAIPDCNGNGIPDSCDIAAGTSADCTANGVPDSCDIASCFGDPACDDCNLNGVPDSCDIAAMTSMDANSDGVPDECVTSTSSGVTINWSDGENWPLGGVDFPDNDPGNPSGVPDLNVTIDGGTILLDTTVEVNSARVLPDGVLSITQAGTGDLAIAGGGDLFTAGIIEVANDRTITVGGTFTVGAGGQYVAGVGSDGCAGGAVCAALTAGSVVVRPGDCTTLTPGGSLILSGGMTLTTTGGLTVEGSTLSGCGGSFAQARGITPPPKFVVRDLASIIVSGSLAISAAVGSFVDSTQPIVLLGDFDNDVRFPGLELSSAASRFDWSQASIRMEGLLPQRFEVAGLDFGPSPEGFLTDVDTLFEAGTHTNFSIGTLTIASGSVVRFVNERINSAGTSQCSEALYVGRLELEGTATIVLDNVRVFYKEFVGDQAAAQVIGCGQLARSVPPPPLPPVDTSSVGDHGQRYLQIATPNSTRLEVIRVKPLSTPGFTGGATVLYLSAPVVGADPTSADPDVTFAASQLVCDPAGIAPGAFTSIAVFGAEIVPSSRTGVAQYEVQRANAACPNLTTDETCWSQPILITQGLFGDVASPYFPDPGVHPDFKDISSYVRKFLGDPAVPSKAAMQLVPNLVRPTVSVDFTDIAAAVGAFLSEDFNGALGISGPCPCPSAVTCGAALCARNNDCVGDQICINGGCVDGCGRCSP